MTFRSRCQQGFVNIADYADTVDISSSIVNDPLYSIYGVGNEMEQKIRDNTHLMYYDPNKDPSATLYYTYLKSIGSTTTLPRC